MSNQIVFILLLGIVMASCRKDKAIPSPMSPMEDCPDFEYDSGWIGITYFSETGLQYKNPCFNPSNNNEFVYYWKNPATGDVALRKHNLSNGQTSIIVENIPIYGQPKWSTKGWIAFTRSSGYVDHIFVVKENGDSLRQFTSNVHNLFPAWSSDGKTLYWQYTPVLGYPYYLLKQELYDTFPDTVFYDYAGYNDISINDVLVSWIAPPPNQNIYLATSPIDNVNFSFQIEIGFTPVVGLSWHPNGYEFFYSEYVDGGLKKFNVNTGQVETLYCHCDTKYYRSPSCSPDGTKLIVERVDQSLDYDSNGYFTGKILQKSSIVLIDLQTLEETTILE